MKNRGAPATRAGVKKPPQNLSAAPLSQRLSNWFIIAICLLLGLAVISVYFQVFGGNYVAYDDDQYVSNNAIVKAGISLANLLWAFTTFFYANWHPLTWISYMIDCQLFGANPGEEHAVNVALHLGASVLLFLALLRMTRKAWRSALVAGIFAIHPAHVESVAWISERKDVLSTFFEMLTLFFYARYLEKRKILRYLAIVGTFALSLMAKPMAVTFPFVLLLLDYWPLRRFDLPLRWRKIRTPVLEKVPLLAMTALTSVLTFIAQRNFGAVATLEGVPFWQRVSNAAVAYVAYIGKAFWPANLAVLYPLEQRPTIIVAGAFLILAAATAVAVLNAKRRPYMIVGWLWYLGMLVPVIGLVQVGVQSMADRYTYLPYVGLSIAIIWPIGEAVEHWPVMRPAAAIVGILVMVALGAATYQQAGYWKNSETLFEHTLAVTRRNYVIENNLGVAYADEGRISEALEMHRAALAMDPDYAEAHANLGDELMRAGKFDEAYPHLLLALKKQPNMNMALADMGLLLAVRGDYEEARKYLERSLRQVPANAEGQSNLCYVLNQMGHPAEAVNACRAALKLKPDMLDAHYNLGNALASEGQTKAAEAEFGRVLATNPNHEGARAALQKLEQAPAR